MFPIMGHLGNNTACVLVQWELMSAHIMTAQLGG
jgi:hypothetical protein